MDEAQAPDVATALRDATGRLRATSDTARLDAELLLAYALGVSRTDLLLRHQRTGVPAAFAPLVERRLRHEPVAYILGHAEFHGLTLEVGPGVLIPRGDSETLIVAAHQALDGRPPARILDLGTGSGALLLAALALWPQADGIGIDRSPAALAIAARNAARHGGRARLLENDWTVPGWAAALGVFDLVLANPPYVESAAPLAPDVSAFEPAGALLAGADGLDAYRVLMPQLPALLTPEGHAFVEIGAAQAQAVTALAGAAGLEAAVHRDLAARDRAVELWKPR